MRTVVSCVPLGVVAAFALAAAETAPPIALSEALLDPAQPGTLELDNAPGAETFTNFHPGRDDPHYNHGVVLFPFKGRLYAQWQVSARDEDAPDTHVLYSVSDDCLRKLEMSSL